MAQRESARALFDSLLIANRGEIACRILRTARSMGIRTVAVYSEADAEAQHVKLADSAFCIGPAAAAESYLRVDRILEAARQSGAQAIHPGYGFLAENADFAEACAAAGVVFVGPPPSAIRAMGSKSEAKALMERAAVPLVPGYHGAEQDEALLAEQARKIGFPVLIKASAGGGGKGMRVVEKPGDFKAALAGARREAMASFGDDRVLIEKYLTKPRHIEIQIFRDSHGNGLHLNERDCSVQRRHQKVLEEAPAPGMTSARRAEMGQAAVAAAEAIDYLGAGTVEFIVEDEQFYFMEMNTRLQVEHPVTEAITGLDLVAWQLRVAAGEALPITQEQVALRGHAIEARLYAEDAERDFLPATGDLRRLRFPEAVEGLRIDSGVIEGDRVSPFYDPMIAKVIAWGETRDEALRRLRQGLDSIRVAGCRTNLAFLGRALRHAAFASGGVDTGFIAREAGKLLKPGLSEPGQVLTAAALHQLLLRRRETAAQAASSSDPHSPWFTCDGWRLNAQTAQPMRFSWGEDICDVTLGFGPGSGGVDEGMRITLAGKTLPVSFQQQPDGDLAIALGDRRYVAGVLDEGDDRLVFLQGEIFRLGFLNPQAHAGEGADAGGSLTAPMPGKVTAVLVNQGERVSQGQALIVLEAMKMEHTLLAPADSQVVALHFAVGDLVEDGVELLTLEPVEA